MRRRGVVLVVLAALAVWPAAARAAEPPSLARARALYNEGDFEGAIEAATAARKQTQWAPSASLVMARAHLERYRRQATPADLTAAREALGGIDVASLPPRDQLDLIVGLGQSLYLGELFGAAAELFDTALNRPSLLMPREHATLLDWWATALDREAQSRSLDRRPTVYERIGRRMEETLRDEPGSAPANYWLAVAARGGGDVERAWSAAIAGWVRAGLEPETAKDLRADLDRLVTQALIPERARTRPQREQPDAVTAFRAEWDLVKEHWK